MNLKSPCKYEVEITSILNCIKNSYENPQSFNFKKSEQVLFRKIQEIKEIYNKTKLDAYQEIIQKALGKYNSIIKKGIFSSPKFISLDKLPEKKALHLNPEEVKRIKNASLELVLKKHEESGKNVARFF